MRGITSPYEKDVVQVLKLGKHYQLKFLSTLKIGGWDEYINFGLGDDLIPVRPFRSVRVNDKKLNNNISRAITTCRNIALSNEWDYFITLTLDPQKYDRFNLEKFHKDLTSFFKFINRKYNCHIKFLLVPEQHKNGAWHMHGLVKDIPSCLLNINENGYLDFDLYSSKFGYVSLSDINDKVAISFYISKHLGKQIFSGNLELGNHLYYCSRGLNRGIVVKIFRAIDLPDNFTFQFESQDKTYKSSFFEDETFLQNSGIL